MINFRILHQLKRLVTTLEQTQIKDVVKQTTLIPKKEAYSFSKTDKERDMLKQAKANSTYSEIGRINSGFKRSGFKEEVTPVGKLVIHVKNKGLRSNNTSKFYRTTYSFRVRETEIVDIILQLTKKGEVITKIMFNGKPIK